MKPRASGWGSDLYVRALRLGERFSGHGGLRINAALARIQLDQLRREEGGRATVWSSPLVPAEILASFGLASVTPETVSAVLASAGQGGNLLERADAVLLSRDCCSFQRAAVGALESGCVPLPAAFVSTAPICDDNPKMCDYLSGRYGREYFLIDVPGEDDSAARDYVRDQLSRFVAFLEGLTGRARDGEALGRAVTLSNRARQAWVQANLLRRDHPPVIQGATALRMAGGLLLQKLGLPELVEGMQDYAREIGERLAAGAFLPVSHRLLWLHLFPLYDREFMRFIEVEQRAVVVFEESSHVWWREIDPRDPLTGLAERMLSCPFAGPVRRRAATVVELARIYRAQGVVNFSHLGCKALSGGVSFVAAALRETGIPFLDLSGDCLDERSPSTAPWRSRIEAFTEMLGN